MSFRRIIIIPFFFCISILAYGQKKMVLYFKDGTTKTGLVTFEKKYVKFQESKKSKKQKIEYQLLDSTHRVVSKRAVDNKRKPKVLYFLPTGKKKKSYGIYEIVTRGKVNLYKMTTQGGNSTVWTNSMGGSPNMAMPMGGGKNTTTTSYGVKRDYESYLTRFGNKDFSAAFITIADSFKSQTAEYFKDCPLLVEKIDKKEKGFTRKDMKKIVNYYNTQCN